MPKRYVLIGLGLAASLMLHPAAARENFVFLGGEDLYVALNSEIPFSQGQALGFIVGVTDTLNGVRNDNRCFSAPRTVTRKQLNDIVKKWFENNPGDRQYAALSVVEAALDDSFPCKGK